MSSTLAERSTTNGSDRQSGSDHPDFNFEHGLPAGVESFSIDYLRRHWNCSLNHVFKLLDKGELKQFGAFDLRTPGASRAMIRVTRASVVAFLNRRQDIEAIADSNPKPAPVPQRTKGFRKGKRKKQ